MGQISCGCTPQHAEATCERGSQLFAAASQAFQACNQGTIPPTKEKQQASMRAHHAYIDHLRGWWEGDRKVQRRLDAWMVYVRLSGVWLFHFETKESRLLQEWLSLQGYQQFVKGGGNQAQDPLSGYYRKFEGTLTQETQNLPSSPEPLSSSRVSSDSSEKRGELERLSTLPFSSYVDLKTRMTVFIALLVARIAHAPTLLDRLHIQQRATHLLQAHGIHVGPPDDQTLRALIDEAIQQHEEMKAASRRTTLALQE